MRNQVFDPGFLFDFYSVRGSTATPFGSSNVRWCGFRIFSARNGVVQFLSFFQSLIAHGIKTRKAIALIFGIQGEQRTLYSKWTKSSAANVDALRR